MSERNSFQHQPYPTTPRITPVRRTLEVVTGDDKQFAALHSVHRVARVLLVHGTFVGNDPLALSETLKAVSGNVPVFSGMMEKMADSLIQKTPEFTANATRDVGNFTEPFRSEFQRLVGDDPQVELLSPSWSSQNHHLARAELAVRLLHQLLQRPVPESQRILLWGHSHAGNAFAILTNLLANDRATVESFFDAAGEQPDYWNAVREQLALAASPHPLSRQLVLAAFGTPVRYGWDSSGSERLIHVLHHRPDGDPTTITGKPLFPLYPVSDVINATYGDWVQSLGIAGTDVPSITTRAACARMETLLERGLAEPKHDASTRLLMPARLRTLCARWKTGTRCHTEGLNLLVDYKPSGLRTPLNQPLETALFGHGVYTTVAWLPSHLQLLMEFLESP